MKGPLVSRPVRNRSILLAELPLLALAAFLAFAVRFDLRFYSSREEFLGFLGLALVVKPIVLLRLRPLLAGLAPRQHQRSVRGRARRGRVLHRHHRAGAVGAGVSAPARVLARGSAGRRAADVGVGRRPADGGARVPGDAPAIVGDRPIKRVLIAGAGDAGAMVVREIKRNPQLGLIAVGLLDDNRSTHGQLVLGVTGARRHRGARAAHRQPSDRRADHRDADRAGRDHRALIDASRRAAIEPRMVPGVYELLGGQVTVSRLRHVEIDDLLRRAPIATRGTRHPYLAGQVVLVTGAGGSIGFELCRQVSAARPRQLIMLGHGENSLFEAQSQILDAFPGLAVRAVVADIRDAGRIRASCRTSARRLSSTPLPTSTLRSWRRTRARPSPTT